MFAGVWQDSDLERNYFGSRAPQSCETIAKDGRTCQTEVLIDWSKFPLVEINPRVQRARPVLRGTRMPVDDILNNYEAGVEPNEIAQLFELPLEQVRQVLAYAAKAHDASSVR